jgi:putative MATE family efflux protein
MGSALRGTGIAKPTMLVQVITVVLNAILAPVLIAGWGTGMPLGVAGAALASSISIAVGVVLMALYFARLEHYVGFDAALLRARFDVWRRLLRVGLPPGGEFALLFIYMGVIYWVIRHFGADAQAGFGIGSRVMQAIFLPVMAIAFAASPVAGQNVGAGHGQRVRETFRVAAWFGGAIMLALTLLCQWRPELLVRGFTHDAGVIAVASEFLGYISWNFLASGLTFTCSGMFQALGNTLPALFSTATRLVTFVLPALWLSSRPGFELHHLWLLSMATMALQAIISFTLLQREFRRRLPALAPRVMATPQPAGD